MIWPRRRGRGRRLLYLARLADRAPAAEAAQPPPLTKPKPPARDATADEAMEDMLGKGGVTTSLDDREF